MLIYIVGAYYWYGIAKQRMPFYGSSVYQIASIIKVRNAVPYYGKS